MAVNLVYVDIKQSTPTAYSRNPKIYFDPDTPNSEDKAKLYELLVNNKWPELGMKEKMREAFQLAKFYGVCGVKTYFFFEKGFTKTEFSDTQKNNEIRTDIVNLKDMVKDRDFGWYTSPWIAHKVKDKASNVRNKFNIAKSESITITTSTKGSKDLDPNVREEFQYATYYEVEDRVKGEIFYIVEGLDRWAKKPKPLETPYDSMWDFVMFNDVPGRHNPYGDYHFWKDQLIELAVYRTMRVNHARKANSKYKAVGSEELTQSQIKQLKSSADTTVVQLTGNQDVVPFQHAPLDPELNSAEASVRGDIQILSKNAPRQVQGTDKTATEVKAIEIAQQEVTSEIRERLEEVMASVATKWAKLMRKNYTTKKTLKLSEMSNVQFSELKQSLNFIKDKNDEGGDQEDSMRERITGSEAHPFLVLTPDDLQIDVKARVKAGSTAPDNDATRLIKFKDFLQTMSVNEKFFAQLDPEETVDEAVDLFGVQNDNLLLRKDNPMEESRLLNAGVLVSPKMNEDHDKHIEVHEAESNGNVQNVIHLAIHKLFKKQLEGNQEAAIKVAREKQEEAPITGESFRNLGGFEQPEDGAPQQQGDVPQQGEVII